MARVEFPGPSVYAKLEVKDKFNSVVDFLERTRELLVICGKQLFNDVKAELTALRSIGEKLFLLKDDTSGVSRHIGRDDLYEVRIGLIRRFEGFLTAIHEKFDETHRQTLDDVAEGLKHGELMLNRLLVGAFECRGVDFLQSALRQSQKDLKAVLDFKAKTLADLKLVGSFDSIDFDKLLLMDDALALELPSPNFTRWLEILKNIRRT